MSTLPEIAEQMCRDRDANKLAAVETYQRLAPDLGVQIAAVHAHMASSLEAPPREEAGATLEQAARSVVALDTLSDPGHPRHTIQSEIARGGMGVVYAARDEILRRDLAVKKVVSDKVPGSLGPSPTATPVERMPLLVRRLMEEAQVTAQLDHSGVVPVHELGIDDQGHVFFTMKRVRGRTLAEVFGLLREGRSEWSHGRALQTFLKICDTLAYAHGKGVIHRDLKPANIMVGRYGEVFVMDWGLAKVMGESHEASPGTVTTDQAELAHVRQDAALTMHGDVIGTLGYMPPEQAAGSLDLLNTRSDIWSLGAMLYEMFAGHAPYRDGNGGTEIAHVLARYSTGHVTPLLELAPDTPPELVSIIERAMNPEPAQRFASATELAEELQAYMDGRVVRSHRTGVWIELRKWIARNRLAAASVLAGVLLLAGGVAAFTWQQREAAVRVGQERDVAEVARDRAEGMQLAARSELAQKRSPAQALELALRAAELVPGTRTVDALYGALRHHRLRDHLAGHEGYVTHGDFAGDTRLVTGDSDGLVIVWDVDKGRALHWFDTAHGAVSALAVAPSGRRAAVGYASGALCVWDVARGTQRTCMNATVEPTPAPVDIVWTAEAELLVARADGSLTLVDAGTGTQKIALFPPASETKLRPRLAQSAPGASAAVFLDPIGGVHRIDAVEGTVRWSIPPAGKREGQHGPHAYLAVDPAAKSVVVGRPGSDIAVYALDDGTKRQVLSTADESRQACLLSPSGQRFCCVVRVQDDLGHRVDRLAKFVVQEDGVTFEREALAPWKRGTRPLAFSADGELMIASDAHDARVIHMQSDREAYPLTGHRYRLNRAMFSRDGQRIVTLNDDRVVRLWRAVLPGEMRGLCAYLRDGWRVVCRTPDHAHALLAQGSTDDPGVLAWVSARTGATAWRAPASMMAIRDAMVLPDGTRVMLALGKGRVLVLDTKDGTQRSESSLRMPDVSGSGLRVTIAPDGSHVVLLGDTPRVYDAQTGDVVCELATRARGAARAVWSPDGKRIMLAHGRMGLFAIHDAVSGAELVVLRGHRGHALTSVWLPDGRVATVARDASVRTWDPTSGEQVSIVRGLPMRGSVIDASADGHTLSFLSTDIYLLDATRRPVMRTVATLPRDDAITSIRFDPNHPRFFTEDAEGGIRTWLLDATKQAQSLRVRGFAELPPGIEPAAGRPAAPAPEVDPLAALSAAQDATEDGDYTRALDHLAYAARVRPQWARLPHARARVHALAGRPDEALAALDQALTQGWLQLIGSSDIQVDPAFDTLRNDPRFTALMERFSGR